MHAVSVACCRERPRSSSHFRVSEQQRNDCLFSPSAPAGACSGLPQGHERPWLLSSMLFTTSLLSEARIPPPVPPINTVHCICPRVVSLHIFLSTQKKNTYILTDVTNGALEAELLIIYSLTSEVHACSKVTLLLLEFV